MLNKRWQLPKCLPLNSGRVPTLTHTNEQQQQQQQIQKKKSISITLVSSVLLNPMFVAKWKEVYRT